ncbi:hypothetical protein ACFFGH_25515 [Lysobacter korlensis]|uniref:FDX-ACB domain-containing protein n=1 Tax=Lysobacter korlensis TaxID=553636 RepID=A0ABV6RW51_9GAMM
MPTYLSNAQLLAALETRDLSDPAQGAHAIQLILDAVAARLTATWRIPATVIRDSPLVAVTDNYDRLGFDTAAVARDQRYSHYVSPTVMLRSHTSASIPAALERVDNEASADMLLVVPGIVHRRDAIDRTHVGTPHQLDLWRITSVSRMTRSDLQEMIGLVVDSVLPGANWRAVPAVHPYTADGRQVDVEVGGEWLELAECGLVPEWLLRQSGLDPERWSGLALGMGLDRALMLRKGIADIRLLRSRDPRAAAQLQDLSAWKPISSMPPVRRDISIVVDRDEDDETLGDRARAALGDRCDDLESVVVLATTQYGELPPAARERLRLREDQANVLVRLTLRPLSRTLTDREANDLRNAVYLALHRGEIQELISAGP